MNEHKFRLGVRLRCKVTGFTGITIGRLEYLNGCIQYGIKPPMKEQADKKPEYPDSVWIDQEQLEQIDEGIALDRRPQLKEPAAIPGGPETRGL